MISIFQKTAMGDGLVRTRPIGSLGESNYSLTSPHLITEAGPFDILLGRGKPYQQHSGNIRLHGIVNGHRERYLKSPRCVKSAIVDTIVRYIKVAGDESGRFLKRVTVNSKEYWVEIDDAEARQKVSHALRGKPRRGRTSIPSASGSDGESETNTSSPALTPKSSPSSACDAPLLTSSVKPLSETKCVDKNDLSSSSQTDVRNQLAVSSTLLFGKASPMTREILESVRLLGQMPDEVQSRSVRDASMHQVGRPAMWPLSQATPYLPVPQSRLAPMSVLIPGLSAVPVPQPARN